MHARRYQLQFIILTTLFSLVLTGCMVGPNFHSPRLPRVKRYTETPLPKKTVSTPSAGKAGKSQIFMTGEDIPAKWWYLFHSRDLNKLVTVGLANSPNLASAYAALRVAQESLNAQIGNLLFPAVNAGFSAQRQRFSGASIGGSTSSNIFNLYNASVSVSYTLDVFGGARRQIEGGRAQVDYQQFQLIAAYLTLTSNIVTTAITVASLREQIAATRDLIRAESAQLNILEKQYRLGGISQISVLTQQTFVDQTRATLPPLEKNLSQSLHALSVLVGRFPDCQLPVIKLKDLHLPTHIPVSLPSYLVRQRPDVRASEALLHVASANIGAATANLFPQVTLTGNDGWESSVLSTLFSPSSKVWSMMASITQPIFHGGALFAQRRQAIAAYDQARANYRQTVLQAFQNVADTLRALETDARTLREQTHAENSARASLNLVESQYKLGGATYLALLVAQQQYQTVRIAAVQAKALRYNDTAALFQALGGGWWNKPWCVYESMNCS